MVDSEHWTLQHCSILRRAPHCTQLSRLLCSAKLNFMMHFARVKRHILSVVCNSSEPKFPFRLFLHLLASKQFHDFEVFLTLKGVVVNIFHPPGGGGCCPASDISHLPARCLPAYTWQSADTDQQLIGGLRGDCPPLMAGKLCPQLPQSSSLSLICVNWEPVPVFHCLSVVVVKIR